LSLPTIGGAAAVVLHNLDLEEMAGEMAGESVARERGIFHRVTISRDVHDRMRYGRISEPCNTVSPMVPRSDVATELFGTSVSVWISTQPLTRRRAV
jgi:hypothetical protein